MTIKRKRSRMYSKDWYIWTVVLRCMHVKLARRKWYGITALSVSSPGRETRTLTGVEWVGDLMAMKRKGRPGSSGDAVHLAAMETNLLVRHQALVAHCAEIKYDDGEPRQPGWFTVKTMGSAWVIEIKDPDSCSRLVVVQQTLDDALTLAQLLLEAEEAPWESDPWLVAARAKKKK